MLSINNTQSQAIYQNKNHHRTKSVNFGMAFEKVSNTVRYTFENALRELKSPEERKVFVEDINKIVESQKNNPTAIRLKKELDFLSADIGNFNFKTKGTDELTPQKIKDFIETLANRADKEQNIQESLNAIKLLG